MSKEFEKDMSKVGADSIPFDNSTPLKELEKIINKTDKQKLTAKPK
jgi:hypothetical protein